MVKGDKEKPEENGGDDETMDSNILEIIRQGTCEPVEDPGAGKDSEKKRGDDEVMDPRQSDGSPYFEDYSRGH